MPLTRVLMADDHQMVADTLRIVLNTLNDFEIVDVVNNGWQALSYLEHTPVDIIIADLHMPLLNGIEMTIRLREKFPKVKVILLTMSEEKEYIKDAIDNGVFGYVMKSADKKELFEALHTVAKGSKYFSEKIHNIIAEIPNENNPNGKASVEDANPLTKREIEILKLIVIDWSNAKISEELHLSLKTVETHRTHILKKTGTNTPIGLMRWALKHGLVDDL